MSDALHVVCPHCHTTNRVREGDLAVHECREVARQPGAMGAADIVRWTQAQMRQGVT
jgi:hypothetical protein